jgi:hypothetical protein
MASLLDIATVARKVPVPVGDGKEVDVNVYGVSAQSIADLMVRFPDIGKSFSGGKPPAVEDIIKFAPEAIAAILAAGTGSAGIARCRCADGAPSGDLPSHLPARCRPFRGNASASRRARGSRHSISAVLARSIFDLVKEVGHPDPWSLTPRQIYFWLQLASKSKKELMLRDLSLTSLASQGSGREIKKQIKQLEKEVR